MRRSPPGRSTFPAPPAARVARASCVLLAAAAFVLLAPRAAAAQTPSSQSPADSLLAARVEAAIRAASDLPVDSLRVEVSRGVVSLLGSVVCEECGGTSTPGGTGTVQQSLGAVVRAVSGVEEVRFYVRYRTR